MSIQILTLFVISSLSPYVSVEKSFLTSNSVDTLGFELGFLRVTSRTTDAIAVGLTAEKNTFIANLSLGIPWHEKIDFLPYLDINVGTKWKNFCGYGGFLISSRYSKLLEHSDCTGINSIYIGISSIHRVKNFRIGFNLQLKRENFYKSIGSAPYFNSVITSQVGYDLWNLNPYLSISLEKRSISDDFSLRAGIGVTLGGIPSAKCEARKIIRYTTVPLVKKPNIYLYPTKPCIVNVILKPNGRILVTDPPYRGSWSVKALPGGVIENTPGYLFYEAQVRNLNVKARGWCISKKEIPSFFYNVLYRYGFNEREINDFVSYWKDKFPPSPYYAIYPIVNEEIDRVCPLDINPEPDKILRVWFVVVPNTHSISLQNPHIGSFIRNGFVVTEWGVIIEFEDGN